MDDRFLVERLKDDDIDALEQLIDKYNGYIATIVLNILGSQFPKEDVQEVINDVFFLLWKNRGRIDIETYLEVKAYIAAIARNEARDRIRALKASLPLNEAVLHSSKDEIEHSIQRKWIMDCIRELSVLEQIVLVKYYYKGESIKQIALEEGIPEATVKTRMRRGKEHLRKLLEKGEQQ